MFLHMYPQTLFDSNGKKARENYQKVADTREARGSQDPVGLTLAGIPNRKEIKHRETGMAPISRFLTQNCSYQKEIQGQKYGAKTEGKETEGKAIQRPPGDPYHKQLPNPESILNAKKCLLTET